jgi:RNA polymerase sigma factor (sigma-70 family)
LWNPVVFSSFACKAFRLAISRHTELDDGQLLRRYRESGDNDWLGLLLQRYTVLLIGVAMKYLKDKEAAHDAVQHVFLKSLTQLPAGEILNFKGWLYILMRNHCLQQLRDKTFMAADEALAYVPAAEDEKSVHLEKELNLEEMAAGLQQIPAEQRTCITEFYLNRKSYQQIMHETGFSFAQVKSHIQNGKRNLRIYLTRQQQNRS